MNFAEATTYQRREMARRLPRSFKRALERQQVQVEREREERKREKRRLEFERRRKAARAARVPKLRAKKSKIRRPERQQEVKELRASGLRLRADQMAPVIVLTTIKRIKVAICTHFGILEAELDSVRRNRHLVKARHTAVYLTTKHTRMSLPSIGRHFGGRDHTTILHARNKVRENMADYAPTIKLIETELGL